jgi:CrcB protein
MLKSIAFVAIGGGAGSILRYLVSFWVAKYSGPGFPLPTLIINVCGCLVIGLLMGFFERAGIVGSDMRLLLVTGFCGGFTTFSTFALENLELLQSGNGLAAFLYIGASVLLGLGAVWAGLVVAK